MKGVLEKIKPFPCNSLRKGKRKNWESYKGTLGPRIITQSFLRINGVVKRNGRIKGLRNSKEGFFRLVAPQELGKKVFLNNKALMEVKTPGNNGMEGNWIPPKGGWTL